MKNNAMISDENHPAHREAALAKFKDALRLPLPHEPQAALQSLYEAACDDTGGSQAARGFVFWLAGQPDPTGYVGEGGIELRRLDHELKQSALQVLDWWAGPTRSDQPLYEILSRLQARFGKNTE